MKQIAKVNAEKVLRSSIMRTTWRTVMKTKSLTFLLALFLSFTCLTGSSFGDKKLTKEETVVSSLGPVKLKTDFTYEFISLVGEEGNVVFRILQGKPYLRERTSLDDMKEFSHYEIYAGCNYTFEIENKTPHKVRIKTFLFFGKLPSLPLLRLPLVHSSDLKTDILEPGSKTLGSKSLFADAGISKTPLTDEEKNNLNKKYGCDAQSGSLYIQKYHADPSVIVFSEKSGISIENADMFGMGSASGVYPIEEKIR